eukprot:274472-Hanusia_phi.AAC.1
MGRVDKSQECSEGGLYEYRYLRRMSKGKGRVSRTHHQFKFVGVGFDGKQGWGIENDRIIGGGDGVD